MTASINRGAIAAGGMSPSDKMLTEHFCFRVRFRMTMAFAMTPEYQARFRRGIEQFNNRHFFEAHETWEEIWLATPEPDKAYLQGIIQIAAAFHHYGRGNAKGTRSLLEAGLRRLERCSAGHFGISMEALRKAAREWATALADGRDLGTARIPEISSGLGD
jgi:predicted metal-dependent hydrolase